MLNNIVSEELQIPNFISTVCSDLLWGLLNKNPSKRLGSKAGIWEIKNHKWCKNLNWKAIYNRKVIPPYLPHIRQSNFESEFCDQKIPIMCPIINENDYDDN